MCRRGAILVVVLVCLAVAAVLFVVLAKQAIAQRQLGPDSLLGRAGPVVGRGRRRASGVPLGRQGRLQRGNVERRGRGTCRKRCRRGANPGGEGCRPAGSAHDSRRSRLSRRPSSPLPEDERCFGGYYGQMTLRKRAKKPHSETPASLLGHTEEPHAKALRRKKFPGGMIGSVLWERRPCVFRSVVFAPCAFACALARETF